MVRIPYDPTRPRAAAAASATTAECPLCLGDGEAVVATGGRFSASEESWYPDETWGVCLRCDGEGVIDVCARCGAAVPADESLPCACHTAERETATLDAA